MQLDEKWDFVGKKQRHCDLEKAADHRKGDCWDHVAYDPEHRLVLQLVVGRRSGGRVLELLRGLKGQLQGRTPRLITSDNFGPYANCVELVFGSPERPVPGGQGKSHKGKGHKGKGQKGKGQKGKGHKGKGHKGKGHKGKPKSQPNHVTLCKRRRAGRVVEVVPRVVSGTKRSVAQALRASASSTAANTSFVERHNATDRHRNARKARRTYRFSKDWAVHEAVSAFTYYSYNFCWCVRTLRVRVARRRYRQRTPAMAAGLTDHVWSLSQWLARPVLMHSG